MNEWRLETSGDYAVLYGPEDIEVMHFDAEDPVMRRITHGLGTVLNAHIPVVSALQLARLCISGEAETDDEEVLEQIDRALEKAGAGGSQAGG